MVIDFDAGYGVGVEVKLRLIERTSQPADLENGQLRYIAFEGVGAT